MQTLYELADELDFADYSDEMLDSIVDRAIERFDEDTDYVVFGVDNRFQVRAQRQRPSTLLFPFNTICLLEREAGRGFTTCTGTLIAPQVVLTAAHCLRNNTRIRVTPGANFSATPAANRAPASPSSISADSSRFRVNSTLDYGVIILPRPFTRPNEFMMLQPRSASGTATLLTIAGYPTDKPRGTMWAHSDSIPLTGVTTTQLFYRLDTFAGQSGSPIWLLGNDGIRLLLGVHRAGPAGCRRPSAPAGGENCGVRITCDVINSIIRWCREFRVRPPLTDSYRRLCS